MNIDKIYNDYIDGKSLKQLAKELNLTRYKIKKYFTDNNLRLRTKNENNKLSQKYYTDETFFDIIDTQEKAYFLGFLYADGCNYSTKKNSSINLSLKESDKEILQVLNNLIQPSRPLYFQSRATNRIKYPNTEDTYLLTISGRYISEQLIKLGCTPRKTHTLKFPTEEQVPSHLIHHFIRGYFDGDGSICKYKVGNYNKVYINIVSTIEFLNKLQELLKQELNFNFVKLLNRFPKRKTNTRSLSFSGMIKCKIFGKWLYKDATIFLNRKKQVFDLL